MTHPFRRLIWFVFLIGLFLLPSAGCVSFNSVDEGAVDVYVGAQGTPIAVQVGVDDDGNPIFEVVPGAMGSDAAEKWVDVVIVQGSEASPDTTAKAAASVAATGQGAATGGDPSMTGDDTKSETGAKGPIVERPESPP